MYRLLLKTHNKTGLKYLCKSEQDDYINYSGSGKYWKPHLKIHGKDIATELLYETGDFERFKDVCYTESIMRNVVKSEEYANLILENGSDGGGGGDYWLGKGGKDHPLFGRERSDLSERNRKDNPMKRPEQRKRQSERMTGKQEIVT